MNRIALAVFLGACTLVGLARDSAAGFRACKRQSVRACRQQANGCNREEIADCLGEGAACKREGLAECREEKIECRQNAIRRCRETCQQGRCRPTAGVCAECLIIVLQAPMDAPPFYQFCYAGSELTRADVEANCLAEFRKLQADPTIRGEIQSPLLLIAPYNPDAPHFGCLGVCFPDVNPPSVTSTTSTSTTTTTICFTDPGDGTIRNPCTGLQWEKKTTAIGSGANLADLHDVDNKYPWAGYCVSDQSLCQPNLAAAMTCVLHADGGTQGCSTCSGTCDVDLFGLGAITTVWDWLNQVNAANFAGHNDWRLPSEAGRNTPAPFTDAGELETIVDRSATGCLSGFPCIHPIFGPTASVYWSSSTSAAPSTYGAWSVDFFDGLAGDDRDKREHLFVRAVRGD